MAESKIPELLEKLEKLDHETYAAWDDTFEEIYDIPYGPLNWESFGKTPVHLLQGVIQEAIAARGWLLDVYYREERTNAYVDNRDRNYVGVGAAAEAILAAYVAALEAQG